MPENETARFLGDPATWAGVRVELADIHGLWGGCSVGLGGDGAGEARLVRFRHHPDGTYAGRVRAEEARGLLELCIAHDLLAIRFPPRASIVPDEAHPEISLINAAGERRTGGCWANEPQDPGFETIYAALLVLADRLATENPASSGS